MKNLLSLLICVCITVGAYAQPPEKFNYQGVARQTNGAAISNQAIGMRISILDGSPTGTPVYVETHSTTTNQFGLYNVAIGGGTVVTGTIANVNWGTGSKYVKVEIDPAGGTSYADLGTAELLSVPYAIYSGTGVPGPAGPAGPTGPPGNANISGTSDYLIKFTGSNTGGNSSVIEKSLGIGIGTTSPGAKLHVSGSANNTVTLGSTTFDHNAAIIQTSSSSTSSISRGLVSYAANSSAENTGLFGFGNGSGSSTSVGVFGLGQSQSTSGTSVGVFANAAGGANNYGLFASYSGNGLAGYFNGAVSVNGALSKSSGTFKIDHPLDPANKYLYHSFVESPDMMNVYNGNITTDGNGVAEVTLPEYFEALNKDFRYQLTVIGTFAQAIIAEKVQGNKFVIKTSEPNVEVSWQVTGIRQDKYAEAHRVVPEVDKEEELKGYYLHPVEHGQPASKSISGQIAPQSAKAQINK